MKVCGLSPATLTLAGGRGLASALSCIFHLCIAAERQDEDGPSSFLPPFANVENKELDGVVRVRTLVVLAR